MDQAVLAWRERRVGRIRLNRPAVLNALDLNMIQLIAAALEGFRADPAVHAVLIDAAGERAFCAGGDICAIRTHNMAGETAGTAAFFTAEYALNQAIADYPKPYVALIDGACLGGGIGVSVHGSHRIATEHAMFAMPETGIALFPDIGASYFLPRLPGRLGRYLGLTGTRLKGADGVHAGLATHFCPRARLPAMAEAIGRDGVAAIAALCEPLPVFTLAPARALIDAAFAAPDVPGIFAALEQDGGTFAMATLAALRAASPSALLWTDRIIRAGEGRELPACLAAELALVRKITRLPEFLEGVRAAVVDKDRAPKWQPARLEDVDPGFIESLFA
jgi:enoyl-CoA hydratase